MKRFYFFPILICSAQLVLAQGRVGINTSSPQAMLHVRDSSVLFSGDTTSNPGNPPASGPGARMMWYADKAAFRAGKVGGTQWDSINIGFFSMALGEESVASGNHSVALGRNASATSEAAIAIGYFTKASAQGSTAIGYNTSASSYGATALGEGTAASALYATAMGNDTKARGIYTTAMGFRSVAEGYASTAMGSNTRAAGRGSTAMGFNTTAKAYASLTIGQFNDTTADGEPSIWVISDPVFIVGNGLNNDQRNNAFVIKKNGNTTINGNTKIALDTEIGGSLTIAGNNSIGGNATIAGTVGIGTIDPKRKLHIVDETPAGISSNANSTLVLEKNGIANYINFLNANAESGILFGVAGAPAAAANGGLVYNNIAMRQGFQIRTGGNATRMVIDSLGNTGIGALAPQYRLHVSTNDAQNFGFREGIMVENTATGVSGSGLSNTGEAAISFKNAGPEGTGSKQWMVGLNQNRNLTFGYGAEFNGVAARMVLDSTGRLGIGVSSPTFQLQLSTNSAAKPGSDTWTVSSDERLKKDMHPFQDGMEVLEKINPIWFTYTGAENHPQEQFVGATAQAIQQAAPYMVTTLKEKSTVGDNLLGVDYGPLQFIMVNAIKEQQKTIAKQEDEIQLLRQRLETLEKRLR